MLQENPSVVQTERSREELLQFEERMMYEPRASRK